MSSDFSSCLFIFSYIMFYIHIYIYISSTLSITCITPGMTFWYVNQWVVLTDAMGSSRFMLQPLSPKRGTIKLSRLGMGKMCRVGWESSRSKSCNLSYNSVSCLKHPKAWTSRPCQPRRFSPIWAIFLIETMIDRIPHFQIHPLPYPIALAKMQQNCEYPPVNKHN